MVSQNSKAEGWSGGGGSRRDFLRTTSLAALGIATGGCQVITDILGKGGPRLDSRPRASITTIEPGLHALGLGSPRDGFLFVPSAARTARVPLLLMFHGATGSASNFQGLTGQAEGLGFALLATDSRGQEWDWHSGYGPDVDFADRALAFAFDRVAVDPAKIAVGGFSDGATYSLTMGIDNGDLFHHALAFAPATYFAEHPRGKPRMFVAHGTNDTVIPVSKSRDIIVPTLRGSGYDVTYEEFLGGHAVMSTVFRHAMDWWAPTPSPAA